MKRNLFVSVVITLVAVLLFSGCATPAPSQVSSPSSVPKPSGASHPTVKLEVMGPQVAVVGGAVTAALADILNKKVSWIKAGTTESIASQQDIIESAKKDPSSYLISVAMPSFVEARLGMAPFDKKYDHVRLISQMIPSSLVCFTSLNPKIKTKQDIAGKKLAVTLLTQATARMLDSVLKVWGIYDSVKVQRMEWGQCYESIKDGLVDVTFTTFGSAPEWLGAQLSDQFWAERSDRIQVISIDAETARKVKETTSFPYLYIEMPAGTRKNQPEKITGMGFSTVIIGCDAKANDELIYEVTKTIYGNYGDFGAYLAQLKKLTPENMLLGMGYGTDESAYHPASVRYWKETGLWQKAFGSK